ncbi:MAG: type II toxin-antitoxin system VapB family antitoxin [Candidatus Acidiferrum sp.]|jgi:antitoxin VapB
MSLNIKDPEAHKLAQLLAKETGETMTAAVTEALRERLDRVRQQRKRRAILDSLMEIGRRGASLFPGPHVDHAELLYDENGLPK